MKAVLALLVSVLALCSAQVTLNGRYCDPTNSWCLQWGFGNAGDIVWIITARGLPVGQATWVGIGLNTALQFGGDGVIGWVQPGSNTPNITCRKLNAKNAAGVNVFTPCYATANPYGYTSSNVGNVTTLAISRPVTSFNKGGPESFQAIQMNQLQGVLWAIGADAPLNPGDNLNPDVKFGSFAANFQAGNTSTVLPPAPKPAASASQLVSGFAALFCLFLAMF